MPAYTQRNFILTMNGGEMSLTLNGIFTPRMTIKADPNNLQPVYVGNIYENGAEGVIRTLGSSNNLNTLQPGQDEEYANIVQNDRLPRTRNFYIERNYLHVMTEWYVKGSVGDIVFVTWLDEGNGFLDINSQTQIDVSTAGLSR